MANKKKTQKNSVKAIWDFITLALASVLLGFIALPHVGFRINILTGSSTSTNSGFKLINFEDGSNTTVATVLLLLAIFASLLILISLFKLLSDAGIIKNKTFSKVVNALTIVLSFAVAVLAIVSMIVIAVAVKDDADSFLTLNGLLGGLASAEVFAVWGVLITNMLLGVATLVTSAFSLKK